MIVGLPCIHSEIIQCVFSLLICQFCCHDSHIVYIIQLAKPSGLSEGYIRPRELISSQFQTVNFLFIVYRMFGKKVTEINQNYALSGIANQRT